MANHLEASLAQGIACVADLNTMRKNGELTSKPGTATKLIGTATVALGGLIPDQAGPTPVGCWRQAAEQVSDPELKKVQQDCEDLALHAHAAQASGPYGSWLSVGLIWLVKELAKILGLSIPA